MKFLCTFCLLLLVIGLYGQQADSTATENPPIKSFSVTSLPGNSNGAFSSRTGMQKKLVIKNNLTFTTYSLYLTPVEIEISDLESLECTAMLKRDTSALKNLWSRDFTLDEPLDEILVNGKKPLPYYTSFHRMVELCTVKDNVVYTSGYEVTQRIKPSGKLEEPVKRNYFHVWTRRNEAWKLSAKTHD